MKLNVMTVFYLDTSLPKKERLDFILQLIQWMYSAHEASMTTTVLFFDKDPKKTILKELSQEPKIARVFLEQFNKIKKIQYKKRILALDLKGITSARLEFFAPAYFSKLKMKGLFTHIDVTFIKQPRIVHGGVSQGLVRNKIKLYQNRAKHYKTFRHKRVFFTWAIFLGLDNFLHYLDLYYRHEKDLKRRRVNQQMFLINNYRNIYRTGTRLNKFEYNYYSCAQNISMNVYYDVYHYDSFFKEGKNLPVLNILKEIECILK